MYDTANCMLKYQRWGCTYGVIKTIVFRLLCLTPKRYNF